MAYRIVADHVRTLSIAICDGCRPGDKGWEYVTILLYIHTCMCRDCIGYSEVPFDNLKFSKEF